MIHSAFDIIFLFISLFPCYTSVDQKCQMKTDLNSSTPVSISRRQFLKLIGLSGLSVFLTNCGLLGTKTPAIPAPTPTCTVPSTITPTSTTTSTATVTPPYKSMAAIGRVDSYNPSLLRAELERMLDGIGGLDDLIKSGARVGIKPNLTGGIWWDAGLPVPATELFATHPALIKALTEILLDAGAGKVTIMEGLGDERIFQQWGYTEMARSLGADLVDLCVQAPYSRWKIFRVGPKFNIYDSFYLNPILNDLDVFISVGKMKCHATTGVTLSLKNLFGIAPVSLYRRHEEDNNRSAFHGTTAFDTRVPRVILDLNMARPVHLAIIDGILTGEGGAGPWDKGLSPVRPGVLVASRDPVAADAVATAIMGFDPSAPSGTGVFIGGDNHLELAHAIGLGTNRLGEIGIAGPSVQEVLYPFKTVN
jgi:uncharacterized protein (DUF362 family)